MWKKLVLSIEDLQGFRGPSFIYDKQKRFQS